MTLSNDAIAELVPELLAENRRLRVALEALSGTILQPTKGWSGETWTVWERVICTMARRAADMLAGLPHAGRSLARTDPCGLPPLPLAGGTPTEG